MDRFRYEEMLTFHQDRNDVEFTKIVEQATGTAYNYACRAKQDTYNVRSQPWVSEKRLTSL